MVKYGYVLLQNKSLEFLHHLQLLITMIYLKLGLCMDNIATFRGILILHDNRYFTLIKEVHKYLGCI